MKKGKIVVFLVIGLFIGAGVFPSISSEILKERIDTVCLFEEPDVEVNDEDENVDIKSKLIGSWEWIGENQIGQWTFSENNTLKSVFRGQYGSEVTDWWTYEVNDTHLCFTRLSNSTLPPVCYKYEFSHNYSHLTVTYNGQSTEWIKIISTIYVDDDNTNGPWDGSQDHPYQNIQDAVDNASAGDTVFVYNGVYEQDITVNVSLILVGEDKYNTIITGSNVSVFFVYSDEVSISNFTIGGPELVFNICGVLADDFLAKNIKIKNNIIECLSFFLINDSVISNNSFQNEGDCIVGGCNNLVLNNKFVNLSGGLIFIDFGISEMKFGNNMVEKNLFKNNGCGIIFLQYTFCQINRITGNNFINNSKHALIGITLDFDSTEENTNLFPDVSFLGEKFPSDILELMLKISDKSLTKENYKGNHKSGFFGQWNGNYWDNWKGIGPKIIPGSIYVSIGKKAIPIPWFQCDWHPAREPYEIPGQRLLSITVSDELVYEGETFTVCITSNGEPVEGAMVEFAETTTMTDQDGKTSFTAPDPGVQSAVYTIKTYKEDFISAEATITVLKLPTIAFIQDDVENTLTVAWSSPSNLSWNDIEITGNCNTSALGEYVTTGDIIAECHGIISIRHIPSNTLLAEFTFSDAFTEFYILDSNGTASDYPRNLSVGEDAGVILGIVNHEFRTINYTIDIWLVNQTIDDGYTIYHNMWFMDKITVTLNHTDIDIEEAWEPQWEYNYTFNISRRGFFKLAFLLSTTPTDEYIVDEDYENQAEQIIRDAYRSLHLWLEVG